MATFAVDTSVTAVRPRIPWESNVTPAAEFANKGAAELDVEVIEIGPADTDRLLVSRTMPPATVSPCAIVTPPDTERLLPERTTPFMCTCRHPRDEHVLS